MAKQINAKYLLALVKEKNAANKKVSDINGTIGERIKRAAEQDNLHPAAFAQICKLARMEVLKRDAFLNAFDFYRDLARESGLFEESVGDIDELARKAAADEQAENEQAAEQADEQAAEENAKRIEEGISPLEAKDEGEKKVASLSERRKRRAQSGEAPEPSYTHVH